MGHPADAAVAAVVEEVAMWAEAVVVVAVADGAVAVVAIVHAVWGTPAGAFGC